MGYPELYQQHNNVVSFVAHRNYHRRSFWHKAATVVHYWILCLIIIIVIGIYCDINDLHGFHWRNTCTGNDERWLWYYCLTLKCRTNFDPFWFRSVEFYIIVYRPTSIAHVVISTCATDIFSTCVSMGWFIQDCRNQPMQHAYAHDPFPCNTIYAV